MLYAFIYATMTQLLSHRSHAVHATDDHIVHNSTMHACAEMFEGAKDDN